MASPRKRASEPTRKGSPLVLILILFVLVVGGVFLYLHFTAAPENTSAPPFVAAPQAEAPTAAAIPHNHIYSETTNPTQDIAAALKQAKAEHKRVILDFGGDWCGDCQVLDIYFHQPPNSDLLDKNFVVAHVFVPHTMEDNHAVALKYNVPLKKGVPALAVLDENGKLLYSQTAGEFESMRHMDASSVTDFLNRWKA